MFPLICHPCSCWGGLGPLPSLALDLGWTTRAARSSPAPGTLGDSLFLRIQPGDNPWGRSPPLPAQSRVPEGRTGRRVSPVPRSPNHNGVSSQGAPRCFSGPLCPPAVLPLSCGTFWPPMPHPCSHSLRVTVRVGWRLVPSGPRSGTKKAWLEVSLGWGTLWRVLASPWGLDVQGHIWGSRAASQDKQE